jgi:hypothetical protein
MDLWSRFVHMEKPFWTQAGEQRDLEGFRRDISLHAVKPDGNILQIDRMKMIDRLQKVWRG